MIGKLKVYLPGGVQDYLPDECYNKRKVEDKIRKFFFLSGYDEVETPVLEYFDVFAGVKTSIDQESMFKLVDPEGRILVLRPDITMPIARMVGTKLKDCTLPLRLSYLGNVYRYGEIQICKQREVAQAGLELLGVDSPEADAEVIAMAIQMFLVGGGCGVAPIKFAASKFDHVQRTCFIGFKRGDDIYELPKFQKNSDRLLIATEDGSIGHKGLVTEILEGELKRNLPDLILACGPVPMLKVIQQLAGQYGVSCQLSLEQRMGCGIGACMTCVCAVHGDEGDYTYKRVCRDGPVFLSWEVMLDEAENGC
jgi:hypothetical protein